MINPSAAHKGGFLFKEISAISKDASDFGPTHSLLFSQLPKGHRPRGGYVERIYPV